MKHPTTPPPATSVTARMAMATATSAAAAAAVVAVLLTGCSAPSRPAASAPASQAATSPATPASTPAGTPAGTPGTPTASTVATASGQPPASPATSASPVSPASPATPATPATAAPVLGQLAGVFAQGQGFGQAEPPRIFNGGDPTGLVRHIHWASWGGSRAIGYGLAEWVGPGQTVATGTQKPATVVAFRVGRCGGKLMYQAVEWYFPSQHQSFSARHYENVCTGSYVPGP